MTGGEKQVTFPVPAGSGDAYTQFLIIGSGIAGLYTALKLAEVGEVTIITKGKLSESATAYAQGGIAAAIGPEDSPRLHYMDTIEAGAGLCHPAAVRLLVRKGRRLVKELLKLGVAFDYRDGFPALTQEAAHSRRRVLHAGGDATGRAISRVLLELVEQNPRIKLEQGVFAAALLTAADGCHGALVIKKDNTLQPLQAGATILSTGGSGCLYTATTNPAVATGDGPAMAYLAGAPLADLEFLQFHPTVLYLPPAPRFLISESVRGEGGILLTVAGKRFMPDYHPKAELAPRDVVSRAIYRELEKSGAGHVYLDFSAIPKVKVKNRFPNIYETCYRFGLDITKEPAPVAPAAHYMMGGILTDLYGRSLLPRLFACGETAGSGVHGANRLASNSLLEGVVFGHRIFEYLRKHPPALPLPDCRTWATLPLVTDPTRCREDRLELQAIVQSGLGIVRRKEGLTRAARRLHALMLDDSPPSLPAVHARSPFLPDYLELQNMWLIARLMLHAALLRTESRGGHYRSDYPQTSPDWKKRILLSPGRCVLIPAGKSPRRQ